MMRLRVGCAGVAFAALVSGCGDPNSDVTIAELKDGLKVHVQLLGTSSPPTARQLYFELVPERASSKQCPVLAAKLTINGVEAEMTSDGSWNNSRSSTSDDGEGWFSEEGPHCSGIGYQLPVDDSLRATARTGVAIQITDESGSFKIYSDDFVSNPEAVMVAPVDGKLRPGNLAVFTVTPHSFAVADLLRASYKSEDSENRFSMDVVQVRDDLFVLSVPENQLPSRGRISVEPVDILPLTMRPSSCDFAQCTIVRTSCADADKCKGTIAFDSGFDSFSIPAEVEE
jgi:hypothetical protein